MTAAGHVVATAIVAGVSLLGSVVALAPAAETAPPRPAQRMIVTFDRMPQDAVALLRRAGVKRAALFPAARAAAIVGPRDSYRRLRLNRNVISLYPEITFEPLSYQTKVQTGVDKVLAGAPPLRSSYSGEGVTVAVVDTGIDTTHPDLDDRVVKNLNFEPSAVLDPISDGDYSRHYNESPVGFDDWGHGTAVAGILGGSGDAALGADDMRGVAPGASLVNLRGGGAAGLDPTDALGDSDPLPEDQDPRQAGVVETNLLAAFQWIIDHRNDPAFPGGIRVVSLSWGSANPRPRPFLTALENILRTAVDSGIVIVVGAGNEGAAPGGRSSVLFPGNLPWLITVGANCKPGDQNDGVFCGPREVANFSSRGPEVDVVAPGVDVWAPQSRTALVFPFPVPGLWRPHAPDTAYPRFPGAGDPVAEANNGLWYNWVCSGTSCSTPHVAGVVSLMLEANPKLTHRRIERILQRTATDLGPEGFDSDYGHGEVDAVAAVRKAENGAP